ncbi:dihydrodipicolinate synthase family protein [Defluviimonas sp. WL0024]|uniref:Dihydrodipicolinate synthase family protein n=1 Tax=Albidovulum salinarum TaxID=2984153 RepID=A0ABT2X955_9RHOB|nr:dihydrodipicolinate synthase family protein [Defluviimonas sp. WL0024]MCU9849909.1 dihydrodipicolinate synthase family protein [Defluviimonas sp. WL0024]
MPAVTTKFTAGGELDHTEMERCFALQIEAGNAGLITCGTLGEGNMLSPDERLEVLKIAKSVAGTKPALLTISEAGTREACALAARAAKAGADGLMIVPSPIYHTNRAETIANLNAIANAGGLPVMIYSNRVGYRVDVTPEMMVELAENPLMVAIKESSDDIRRCTEIFNTVGGRFKVLTGVDNLGLEALLMGCDGWVSGVSIAFPKENQAIYDLAKAGRIVEAREIYRWLRPLLDLDVSTFLVQQIKLAEAMALGSTEHVRAPRMPLTGEHRARVEALIAERIACRPDLAKFAKAA